MFSKVVNAIRAGVGRAASICKSAFAPAAGAVMVGVASAHAALPTDYAALGTDATDTFDWVKTFVIGAVGFSIIVSLVRRAKKG